MNNKTLLNPSDKLNKMLNKINLLRFPTYHLCFIETRRDTTCTTSVTALCFIGNEAISQDVTVSMCQQVAVMEGIGRGYWGGIQGFGWINLQWQLPAASAKTLRLNNKPVNAST